MEPSNVEVCEKAETATDIAAPSQFAKDGAATLPATPPGQPGRLRIGLSVLAIVIIGGLAYLNSFEGAFVFDDQYWIGNPAIRQLWPPWQAMFSPVTVSRPLIGLSLAINYQISGARPWSYHAFNLTIHILAALTLFGIVRRTLLSDSLQKRFGQASTPLALVIALIWMVHPLQTQSVTYIIQRCESLMGLFYLLTLYSAIRSYHSRHRRWWYAAAIAACAGGALSKQVIVTAPIMALVYDVLFLSGSLKEVWRKRLGLYAGLFATWSLLVLTTLAAPKNGTAGFAVNSISALDYFKSQFGVIVYYLRLSVWPDPLCLDYGWKKAGSMGEILPYAAVVLVLVGATLWALWQRRAVSFLGVWFFLILALTSSIMPFDDLIYEHRMYLSLAAVVGLVVLSAYDWGKRVLARVYATPEQRAETGRLAAITAATLVVTLLSLLTLRRNVDYKSQIVMWQDVVNKCPVNARGQNNLGNALLEQGLVEEALPYFTRACEYKPDFADAENNVARVLIKQGKLEEAKTHLLKALQIDPQHGYANFNMGQYLSFHGHLDEAIEHFYRVLAIDPNEAEAYAEVGMALERQGKLQEALNHYNRSLQNNPEEVDALGHQALILVSATDPEIRDLDKALRMAEKAVQLTQGRLPFFWYVLAVSYAEAGRFPEAVESAQQAKSLSVAMGNSEFAEVCETRVKLYKEGRTRLNEKPEKPR